MGFVVGLDTTAAFQIMISQPLVACSILGWMMGDPVTGAMVGAVTQLLWMGKLPVGAASFPDGNLGSLVAAAIAVHCRNSMGSDGVGVLLALVVLWGSLTAWAGGKLIVIKRKIHTKWVPWFGMQAQQGNFSKYSRGHMLVTLWNGGVEALSAVVFFLCGVAVIQIIFPALPARIHQVGSLIPYFLLGMGLVQVLILFRLERWVLMAVGLVVGFLFWGIH